MDSSLEPARALGIDIGHGCRAGSCGACAAEGKGEVKMAKGCEIDPRLSAAGFVATGCARALADLGVEAGTGFRAIPKARVLRSPKPDVSRGL